MEQTAIFRADRSASAPCRLPPKWMALLPGEYHHRDGPRNQPAEFTLSARDETGFRSRQTSALMAITRFSVALSMTPPERPSTRLLVSSAWSIPAGPRSTGCLFSATPMRSRSPAR